MGSDGNRLTENFVFDNLMEGVVLDDSSNNRIERNSALDDGANGIFVTNVSNNNRIRRNSASDNGADGILVDATSSGTLLVRNRAHRNANDDGIEVANPVATVTRNTANNNVDYGIEAVVGVTDGGGNTASGNGNAAQCLNVVCN
jgi:parallel beta-helix repeat protein